MVNRRNALWAAASLGLLSASVGCAATYVTAVPSVQQRAFVVRSSGTAGSSFWNCDASSGAPVCYQVIQVAAGEAPVAPPPAPPPPPPPPPPAATAPAPAPAPAPATTGKKKHAAQVD